jgi:hypothetical protein
MRFFLGGVILRSVFTVHALTAEGLAQSIVATEAADSLPSLIRAYVIEYFQKQSTAMEKAVPVLCSAAPMDLTDTWILDPRPPRLN